MLRGCTASDWHGLAPGRPLHAESPRRLLLHSGPRPGADVDFACQAVVQLGQVERPDVPVVGAPTGWTEDLMTSAIRTERYDRSTCCLGTRRAGCQVVGKGRGWVAADIRSAEGASGSRRKPLPSAPTLPERTRLYRPAERWV